MTAVPRQPLMEARSNTLTINVLFFTSPAIRSNIFGTYIYIYTVFRDSEETETRSVKMSTCIFDSGENRGSFFLLLYI